MATQTFTWPGLLGATGDVKFRVLQAQFSDGYAQTAGDGINNKIQTWPLTFVAEASDIAAIKNFLDSHKGCKSFYWTPPGGEQGFYKCAGYGPSPLGGAANSVTATFVQDFKP